MTSINEYVYVLKEWIESLGFIKPEPITVGYSYWTEKPKKRVMKIDDRYPGSILLAKAVMDHSPDLLAQIKEKRFDSQQKPGHLQQWVVVRPRESNVEKIKECILDTCNKVMKR